ncbi:MAG: phosphate signaling complex protein PhoU [Treponemataceae bacterium]
MPTRRFDNEMQCLNLDIIKIGSLIENALHSTIKALLEANLEIAKNVMSEHKNISELSSKIEREALKILLIEHPVASDLRTVSTALKVVTDMYRMGVQAKEICEIIVKLFEENLEYKNLLANIPKMANDTAKMVRLSLDSFVKKDFNLATDVINMDNTIDDLFDRVKDAMIDLIKTDSQNANQAIYLMMVAKYFEKIADHGEAIASWVQFSITGERKNIKLL